MHYHQSRVQVGVVAQHGFHYFRVEKVVLEQCVVGLEEDVSARFVLGVGSGVALQLTFLEHQMAHLALAVGLHLEVRAQRIDRLHAHPVQSYALLESLRVVFSSGVEHAHGLHQLALRYAAAIVAHADTQVFVYRNLNALACVHLELVDAVVDYFLQKHVDAVLGKRAVAQPAYIHTRSGAHVLHVA